MAKPRTRWCARCGGLPSRKGAKYCRPCWVVVLAEYQAGRRSTARVRACDRHRLYLVDGEPYRLRLLNASLVRARWRDALGVFETGRGAERRTIDVSRIGAVLAITPTDNARTVKWVPIDDCYRAIHKRPDTRQVAWVHPYARAAA